MKSIIDFLRILFERRKEQVTLLVLEDDRPNNPQHYTIRPQFFFLLTIFTIISVLVLIVVLLFVTPLGNMLFDKDEAQIRSELFQITDRIATLQDSLEVRDRQLSNIKEIIAAGSDTTFTIESVKHLETLFPIRNDLNGERSNIRRSEMRNLSSDHIIHSRVFKQSPNFPAQVPLDGTLTQSFNAEKGHFGIDIAAQSGSLVRAVADGVVINGDWTVNYGYVIHIQHGGGYVTTYKHLSNVLLRDGDLVLKGDLLGAVGRSGFLTSGPHLHFEIWQDGVPLNPASFLINL